MFSAESSTCFINFQNLGIQKLPGECKKAFRAATCPRSMCAKWSAFSQSMYVKLFAPISTYVPTYLLCAIQEAQLNVNSQSK